MSKRKVEIVIISDTHLGTYGCHADELLKYLKSIEPDVLVLNGDVVDIWNFSKSYFPKSHMQVLRQVLKMTENGTKTYYITGNHDEALRKYSGTQLGNFTLDDKLILELEGQKIWIFHGDVFDSTTKGSARFIAKLGGKGYDILILMNRLINNILKYFGKEKVSFSKRVKNSVKKAVSWISNFEETASILAIDQNYDVVICGHIHQPQDKVLTTPSGSVRYLNSGDWVENCTALEYENGQWNIYKYPEISPDLVHNEMVFDETDDVFDLKIFNINSIYENSILSSGHR